MTVTETYTYREICEDALRKLGIIAKDEAAQADDIATAKRALNRMLKSWQNRDIELFTVAKQSVSLTTAVSYTMSPVRPLSVDQVNYKSGGTETPMTRMTREEYDSLPIKTSTGQPTAFYYDRQREAALLYVWPALSSASGQTLEVTYTREIEDVSLEEAIDIPGEWYDAAVYGLADRLSDDYERDVPKITQRAQILLDEALSFDREGSLFFAGPNA